MKYIILETIQEAKSYISRIEQHLKPSIKTGEVYTKPVIILNPEHVDHEKFIVKILTDTDYSCVELFDVEELKEFDNTWFQTPSGEEPSPQ